MSQRSPEDLSSLVDAASKEVVRQENARVSRQVRREGRTPSRLVMYGLVVAAAIGVYGLWTQVSNPSAAQVGADLGQALDLARASVEEARRSTGALPETLPNASLASVVYYERRSSDYRLSASVGGVRVMIEWDGSKKIDERGTQ